MTTILKYPSGGTGSHQTDWTLTAYHQNASHPYLPFVCFARRESRPRPKSKKFLVESILVEGFNREGRSEREAILACVEAINRHNW